LSPEYQNRNPSLKEKSMSIFHRSKLPFFDFEIVVEQSAKIYFGDLLYSKQPRILGKQDGVNGELVRE
jgi:hypothetical protein